MVSEGFMEEEVVMALVRTFDPPKFGASRTLCPSCGTYNLSFSGVCKYCGQQKLNSLLEMSIPSNKVLKPQAA